MKFGVSTFVTDESIRPVDLATALEERGFDALFLAEHSHIPASRESPYPEGGELPRKYYRTLDPFVVLSAAAAVTRRLVLATGIALIPQRDPIHTAKEVSSLDLISDGRAILGVGGGWNKEEMRNHGTDPAARGALLDERVLAIRRIWTEELAEFHGEHVDLDPIYQWPKPVQTPHPPIYVGGESRAALRRLAEYGDGWLPRANTPRLAARVTEVRAKAGRDLPVTVFGTPDDPATISELAEAGVGRCLFDLETAGRDETLRRLDALASLAST
ncbi:LLM class F420-dependent oxidoreductase [Actinoalloteichus caeruleus]|uniref:F420-dependent oxidoreductase, Rv2161c family n=1 Tax=Actinoalloteichus caeruleus DSM 43889 TaxID=1120930 RepID=A0ABT1JKN8_ACTCY|nr:LLM class F420-dependent oxidoreductase [Actinoalloteichus caeruleus]MCP2333080.1 putative F420-dependent oxidoreductase, Rv2161c family [Actinoalloteichus caeruleus DSM 43889]